MEREVNSKFKVKGVEFTCEVYYDHKPLQCFSCSLSRYGKPHTFVCKEAGECKGQKRKDGQDVVFIGGIHI